MTLTLYHNPACSKSRATLALIREAGIEPVIVEYLKTPLSVELIEKLLRESGMTAAQAVRTDTEAYRRFVAGKSLTDEALIRLMAAYPALLNRPFVSGEKGTKFCRPPELVKTLL